VSAAAGARRCIVAALLSKTLAISCALVAVSGSARAESNELRATYVEMPAGMGNVIEGRVASPILFLDRCTDGCTMSPGWEDSRTNHSSIIDQPSFIPPFAGGDPTWNAIVGCVRAMYSDFDIRVTDENPGDQPHFKAIVAGNPEDVGFPFNVGGVAPFSCGVVENSITYTFAGAYGDKPQEICHTIAQESAHAFGLDHEHLCEDPMTYLSGCGAKCFQNVDAPCGELGERRCHCGGNTQNSWQRSRDTFGDSPVSRETVTIAGPFDGDTVKPGFHVDVDIAVSCIAQVEVWVNDEHSGEVYVWPFVFNTPPDLPPGPATIRAVATDSEGNQMETSIEVVVKAGDGEPDPDPDPMPDPDPELPEPQADCGCATGGGDAGGTWLLAIGVALLVAGRRRRPSF
jgi:MYXO-CTERM domain-containing protein